MVSAYVLLTMSVPLVGAVIMVPVVSAIDVMSVFAPKAAALRLVRAAPALLALVPPLAKGSMPVTCVVRSTPESVPPSVSDPDDVTVPVSVMPLTVPVPPTEVTVPTNASVALIVIAPVPFVMVTFVPAVSVALVSVLPVVFPISSCPLVYVVSPVPPLATASVPPIVIVPDVVIGPPLVVKPVVPPLTATLETVPVPVSVTQVGAAVPFDVSTCPIEPSELSANFVPVEYTTAPATGDRASPVPPRPKGSAPWVWFVSDRSKAGWIWSPRDKVLATPAVALPSAKGVVEEKLAVSVMSLASEPPPVRPLPAVIVRVVGTKPVTLSAAVVTVVTRPVASTVRTGTAEPDPYVPAVTPVRESSVTPTPPAAIEMTRSAERSPPPERPVPDAITRVDGTAPTAAMFANWTLYVTPLRTYGR